jgi:peptide/nickel transport system substrate-binding protein
MRGTGTRVLAVLAAGTLLAVGCGGDDDGGGGSASGGDGANRPDAAATGSSDIGDVDGSGASGCAEEDMGGTLTFGQYTEPIGLDPLVQTARGTFGGTELTAVYDTLMRYDPQTAEYEPRVAESLEPNDEFTDWTLTLREGVTFPDGAPLTSEVVKFSVERHMAEDSRSTYRNLLTTNLGSIEVVDDLSLVFHLNVRWTGFASLLGAPPGMPVNPAVLEEGGPEALANPPQNAGVGPFTVARYAPDEEIVMAKREDYWGGPVCLDELRFVRVPGGDATYDAFRNGELDVAFLREPTTIADARADGVSIDSSIVNGGGQLMINNGAQNRTPPTTDVRIRQALAHALDPELINERVYDGTGLPTSAMVYEESRLYQDLEGPEYDPERARELVEEVEAEGEWDGSIEVTLNNAPESVELGIVVEALLEDAGFEAEVDSSRSIDEVISQVITEANYEVAGWSLSMSDASPWTDLTERIDDNPYMGYADPDMQAALTELREAATPEAELEAMATIQEVWTETVPSLIYSAVEDVVIWSDQVEGLVPTHYSVMYFDDAHVGEG